MAGKEKNDSIAQKRSVMRRFSVIYFFSLIVFAFIAIGAFKIVYPENAQWQKLSSGKFRDSLVVTPNRGNILDCNGKLLAATIHTYIMHIDFKADGLTKEIFESNLDSLAMCLSSLYETGNTAHFKQRLRKGFNSRSRYFKVDSKPLSYTEYKKALTFPLFRLGPNVSGLTWDTRVVRQKPFGMLASRSIGQIYSEQERGGMCGIEMGLEDELKGEPGIAQVQKKAGRKIKVPLRDATDGKDVLTTIDIEMQDITESALMRWMKASEADQGCAVLMEVKSGEVKAIANLTRHSDGAFVEDMNYAVNSLSEPGSTFKTASVMVALDDGITDTSEVFDTGLGEWKKDDWTMTDHNVKYGPDGKPQSDGGYGEISLAQSMWYSSNIGIAKMVEKYYQRNPGRFVNKLYDMKLKEPMDIVIPGAATPNIPNPDSKGWNKASMLWMSFGYGLQIPPIYTLTFYNGIANDGRMISPLFVKSLRKNKTTEKTFHSKEIKKSLCSKSTLRKINDMLVGVMTKGTGRGFNSDIVQIAGKTGTAQTNYWASDKTKRSHQYSFCGYFPAQNPKYSCIVVIWHPHKAAGVTGSISGHAFKDIAERIYARSPLVINTVEEDKDSNMPKMPVSMDGNRKAIETVLDELDIEYDTRGANDAEWATTTAMKAVDKIVVTATGKKKNTVPNVKGMGVKDAIYLLEQCGLKTQIEGSGYGEVTHQSIEPYTPARRGETIVLTLKHHL